MGSRYNNTQTGRHTGLKDIFAQPASLSLCGVIVGGQKTSARPCSHLLTEFLAQNDSIF